MLTLALLAASIVQQTPAPSVYDEFGTLRRVTVWGECEEWRNGVLRRCR